MHGKLISEGKVEKLTYRQLRALERIDAKKEKDARRLELYREIAAAAGRTGQGIFQGTITGPIALTLILTATYPGWLPIVTAAAQQLADAIASGWKLTGGGPSAPTLDHLDGGSGNFGVNWEPQQWVTIVEALGAGLTAGGTQWYDTAAARDAAYNADINDTGKNWYWAFTKVQR